MAQKGFGEFTSAVSDTILCTIYLSLCKHTADLKSELFSRHTLYMNQKNFLPLYVLPSPLYNLLAMPKLGTACLAAWVGLGSRLGQAGQHKVSPEANKSQGEG